MSRIFSTVHPRSLRTFLVCALSLTFTPSTLLAGDVSWIARGENGMVAAGSRDASRAGLEILRAGGNAIDAAVAVSFALGVTRSYSTGPGGGGFMIARFADGRVVVQDFRETAPAAATADMFVRATKSGAIRASRVGHLAVGVPGLVAGRCQALAQWGTLPIDRVLAPAIRLAESGFAVNENFVRTVRSVQEEFERDALKERFAYLWRTHLHGGHNWNVGEVFTQPALARLLRAIAKDGPPAFYRGPVAKAIAQAMTQHGGLVTERDLAEYRPRLREPIISTYRDYSLILMPPSSSGGVALAQALNTLEVLGYASVVKRDASLAVHYRIEAMKHAFADRARWLGDDDFVAVPTRRLLSKSYARGLAEMVHPDHAFDVERYGSLAMPKDAGTSHFCVADQYGNVVVSSETINTSFGSFAVVDEWGLILNNQMDDFTTEPGKPNAYGLIQSQANAIAPGKRPLSSMSPTIVLKGNRPMLLLGASGGPHIITSVLNVLLGVTDAGLSLEEAMLAVRPHHQWQPDEVLFDRAPSSDLTDALTERGHRIAVKRRTGIVQAIRRTDRGWVGGCDPRKGGEPAGY